MQRSTKYTVTHTCGEGIRKQLRFNCLRNVPGEPAEVRTSGRMFHTASPATAKARGFQKSTVWLVAQRVGRYRPAGQISNVGLADQRSLGQYRAIHSRQHGKLVLHALLDEKSMQTGLSHCFMKAKICLAITDIHPQTWRSTICHF